MKKLLFVNSCVRGEASRTLELSRFYIDGFIAGEKAAGRSGRIRSIARSMQKVLRVTDSLKAFLIIVYLVSILM